MLADSQSSTCITMTRCGPICTDGDVARASILHDMSHLGLPCHLVIPLYFFDCVSVNNVSHLISRLSLLELLLSVRTCCFRVPGIGFKLSTQNPVLWTSQTPRGGGGGLFYVSPPYIRCFAVGSVLGVVSVGCQEPAYKLGRYNYMYTCIYYQRIFSCRDLDSQQKAICSLYHQPEKSR